MIENMSLGEMFSPADSFYAPHIFARDETYEFSVDSKIVEIDEE
jgi:hypothetical protein